jgi:DNA replication protein DnaC
MSAQTAVLEAATIGQQCKVLHLPTVAAQCAQLAEQAVREHRTHLGFLEALLQTELEDREHRLVERRIREAHLPRMKTLEEFDSVERCIMWSEANPPVVRGFFRSLHST